MVLALVTCAGALGLASGAYGQAEPPSISKAFGAPQMPITGSTSLTFMISNPNAETPLSAIAFTDTLPSGLVVSTPNGLTGSCGGGTITATAGSSSVSLSGASLAGNASCTFSANVTGTTIGVKINSVTVASAEGGTGNTSTANLTVVGPPTFSKSFAVPSIPLGGSTSLGFSLANPNATVALTGIAFTDTLPAGLEVATPNNFLGSTCGGVATATAGSNSISLSGGSIAAGGSCVVGLQVTGIAAGVENNASSTVTSNEGGTGTNAQASITVVAPPTISKVFAANAIPQFASTSLTFSLANPNNVALSGVAFTDTLPAGLVVATPNGLSSNCGGTTTATAGSNTITLSSGSLAANGSCTIAVGVTGSSPGVQNNITSTVTSTEGGTGLAASASITVLAPIPTLDGWGLLGLAALLGVAALLVMRRSS